MSDDRCEFSFDCSEEEIASADWLMDTLRLICENQRPNAAKAKLCRDMLHRWAEHAQKLHDRVHELEDVLHSLGMREVVRCASKEMN